MTQTLRTRQHVSTSARQHAVLVISLAVLSSAAAHAADARGPLPPGTYRLEMRVGARTAVPVVGTSNTTTTSVSQVDIRAEGSGGLRQTHKVCETRFDGGVPLVRMSMPPRFIAALAEHSYPIDVVWKDEHWSYRADLGVERVGYRPQPGYDAVPTSAESATVIDSDGDGHPGATLELSVARLADGELYIAQRGHSILEGRVVAVGQVEGRIDVRVFEQSLLGADPSFLARAPDITIDPARSTFRLERVPDGATCATMADLAEDRAATAHISAADGMGMRPR